MTEKRYFKKEWEEEYYIFDSTETSEEKVDEEIEYGYEIFADAMTGDTVVERLNEQEEEINTLKFLIIDDEAKIKELEKENEQLTEKPLRFGKFRQKMCDLLWECGCDQLGLSDETNEKRIFNSANYICNELLKDYIILDKK